MAADAYLRGHSLPRLVSSRRPGRARLRRRSAATFEDDAFTERAFRAGRRARAGSTVASAPRRSGSPTAPCSARGTTDAAIERLAERSTRAARPAGPGRPAARPLRAALRRRRPPTTPRSTRPSSWSRAPAPPTPPASSTRSCGARPRARRADRGAARRRLDPGAPPRSPTRRRLWLARMWWEELGAEGARVAARRLQRAGRGRAARATCCAASRDAQLAELREAGVEARRRGPTGRLPHRSRS